MRTPKAAFLLRFLRRLHAELLGVLAHYAEASKLLNSYDHAVWAVANGVKAASVVCLDQRSL